MGMGKGKRLYFKPVKSSPYFHNSSCVFFYFRKHCNLSAFVQQIKFTYVWFCLYFYDTYNYNYDLKLYSMYMHCIYN